MAAGSDYIESVIRDAVQHVGIRKAAPIGPASFFLQTGGVLTTSSDPKRAIVGSGTYIMPITWAAADEDAAVAPLFTPGVYPPSGKAGLGTAKVQDLKLFGLLRCRGTGTVGAVTLRAGLQWFDEDDGTVKTLTTFAEPAEGMPAIVNETNDAVTGYRITTWDLGARLEAESKVLKRLSAASLVLLPSAAAPSNVDFDLAGCELRWVEHLAHKTTGENWA